jgi:hypothetical protein
LERGDVGCGCPPDEDRPPAGNVIVPICGLFDGWIWSVFGRLKSVERTCGTVRLGAVIEEPFVPLNAPVRSVCGVNEVFGKVSDAPALGVNRFGTIFDGDVSPLMDGVTLDLRDGDLPWNAVAPALNDVRGAMTGFCGRGVR